LLNAVKNSNSKPLAKDFYDRLLPICDFAPKNWLQSDVGIAILDAFPLRMARVGHSEKARREPLRFNFGRAAALWKFVGEIRGHLLQELHPDGFNIG